MANPRQLPKSGNVALRTQRASLRAMRSADRGAPAESSAPPTPLCLIGDQVGPSQPPGDLIVSQNPTGTLATLRAKFSAKSGT